MTEVSIPLEAVRRHARSVDGVAADLKTAHSAANQVYLDNEAFGLLCQFLPRLFDPVLRAAAEAIADASTALTESGGKLRSVADRSQTTDEHNASTVTASGSRTINIPL